MILMASWLNPSSRRSRSLIVSIYGLVDNRCFSVECFSTTTLDEYDAPLCSHGKDERGRFRGVIYSKRLLTASEATTR